LTGHDARRLRRNSEKQIPRGLKPLGMTKGEGGLSAPFGFAQGRLEAVPSRKLRGLKAAQDDSLHDSLQDMTRSERTR